MKIKKVDDRPIIIHTKEKARIHIHENQDAKIEGHNIEEVDHSSMSTIHQNRLRNLNPISQYRQKRKDSNRSVKVKNSTIKNAGLISANTTVNQLEGGEEIRNSAMIASTIARPVTDKKKNMGQEHNHSHSSNKKTLTISLVIITTYMAV